MIDYPTIDPILVSIGPLHIRWYGLAYIAGIMMAMSYLKPTFTHQFSLSKDQQSTVMITIIAGIMIGGRLGYIVFYDLAYYLHNPSQWLAVWNGGMSYHGGALGAVGAMVYLARHFKVSFISLLDILGIGSTFGLFFGRIANFINGELYGRVTDVPWAMVFPSGGLLPRHPSQLYEAFFEGFVLFTLLHFLKKRCVLKPGQLFGVYLLGYGLFRFFIEFVRQPDYHLGTVLGPLSMGQVLCVVMVMGGLLFWHYPRDVVKHPS
jgi:phosphatidylglycerol:prolipoprotein diacylglycerol transferase